jgi:hypothetical protein
MSLHYESLSQSSGFQHDRIKLIINDHESFTINPDDVVYHQLIVQTMQLFHQGILLLWTRQFGNLPQNIHVQFCF